ncbi:hypothetical protein [Xenorhabdus bovienii]|uniref:Uncharacterized protein n=1 Tax=Xenorhabdus bovienii str. Intermedium TaxID=1379677 RepID=A0A077QP06_XENBV|nr:hypothetical protein [Xenorhabdus bovienii]CDH33986.1 hypothetical protein; putative membrane protein [Xenorhabdus bovienii str. Intermedium]
MSIKEFIYNVRLNSLLIEVMNLDRRLKINDSSLKEEIGYKQFKYHFNPVTSKVYFLLGIIGFSLVLSSSMLLAVLISYVIDSGVNKLAIITCMLLVFSILSLIFFGFLSLGKGGKEGIYIHRILYQSILVISVLLLFDGSPFLHFFYYALVMAFSLLIKIIMNGYSYFNAVRNMKLFRITHIFLTKDTQEILNMPRKESKKRIKEVEFQRRREIKEKKRAKKTAGK